MRFDPSSSVPFLSFCEGVKNDIFTFDNSLLNYDYWKKTRDKIGESEGEREREREREQIRDKAPRNSKNHPGNTLTLHKCTIFPEDKIKTLSLSPSVSLFEAYLSFHFHIFFFLTLPTILFVFL